MFKGFVFFALFLLSCGGYAITPVSPIDAPAQHNIYRVLRGEFRAYDASTRVLDSSVGQFNVPSAAGVLDRIGAGSYEGAKVSLKFRSDILVEVVIHR